MLTRRSTLCMGALGVIVLLLLAPVAVVGSQRAIATTFNSPMDWVPPSFPERVRWADFTTRFQLGEVVMLSWPEATLSDPRLALVAEAIAESELETVRSATPGNTVFKMLQEGVWGVSEKEAIKRLQGSIIGPDGLQSLVVVHLTAKGSLERNSLIKRLKHIAAAKAELPISEIRAVGIPVEGSVIDASASESIAKFAVPSAVLAILVCWICLRSVWLTAAISGVAMVGQGLSLGTILLTGHPMNAVLIVLPPLVFVLTVSSGIHLANYFLEAITNSTHAIGRMGNGEQSSGEQLNSLSVANHTLNSGNSDRALAAVLHALRAGTVPCFLASFTTIIGLVSLALVPIVPVRHFGIIAATNIALTLLLLLMILPASMLLAARGVIKKISECNSASSDKNQENAVRLGSWRSNVQQAIDWCYRLPVRKPLTVSVVILSIAGFFASGLKDVETSVAMTSLFSPDHPMRQEYDWFEKHIGPTVFGEIQVCFSDLDDSGPVERLKLINQIHRTVADQPDVSGVLSAGIFLPTPPRSNSITTRARQIFINSQINNLEPDSQLVTEGLIAKAGTDEFWRISYRVPLNGRMRQQDRIVELDKAVREVLASSTLKVDVQNTGGVILFEAAQASLLSGLLNSFVAAFAVVAVVMMFLLRSVLGGCLAMIPNVLPTLVTFGFLGLTRIPVDIGAVMTASLALGIAVDDTVHLLSRFASFKLLGHSASQATLAALRQCGPAMTHTTFVCGLSLMVYVLSDFMPTKRFSLLMVCLLSTAIIGDMVLLPAMLASRLGQYLARPVLASNEPLGEADCAMGEKGE